MDFAVRFEDGSDGYLAHHGVQGMHWGIWNAETRARYAEEGKAQQGGGGMSDEEKEEVLRENGLEGTHRTQAIKQVEEDRKNNARDRLSAQARLGKFGGDATSRVNAANGYLKARAVANSRPGFLSNEYRNYGIPAVKRFSVYAKSTANMVKNGKTAASNVLNRIKK